MSDYYVDAASGNDGNAGSAVSPWKTMQKAADTAVAGDIVYGRGTETVATVIDFDTNAGTEANRIRFIACDSSWTPTIGGWALDGAGAIANLIKYYSTPAIKYVQFEGLVMGGVTAGILIQSSTYITGWTFIDCEFKNALSFVVSGFLRSCLVLRCYMHDITSLIGTASRMYGAQFVDCTFRDCTNGWVSSNGGSSFVGCLFDTITNYGIKQISDDLNFGNISTGNTFYACGIGWDEQGSSNFPCLWNRFISCTIAIKVSSTGSTVEDYNYFGNCGTDISVEAGSGCHSGGHSVSSAATGVIDGPNGDLRLTKDALMQRVSVSRNDGINTDYRTAGALVRYVDYPALSRVMETDTVDGEGGTLPLASVLTSAGGTFDEAARNKDPGIADVTLGKSYKIYNFDLVGTKPGGSLDAPGMPTASVTRVMPTNNRVTWTPGSLAATYTVQRKLSTDTEYTTLLSGISASCTYSDNTAVAGTIYDYRVQSVNAAGTTSSAAVRVTTLSNGPDVGDIWDAFKARLRADSVLSAYVSRWFFQKAPTQINQNDFPFVHAYPVAIQNDNFLSMPAHKTFDLVIEVSGKVFTTDTDKENFVGTTLEFDRMLRNAIEGSDLNLTGYATIVAVGDTAFDVMDENVLDSKMTVVIRSRNFYAGSR